MKDKLRHIWQEVLSLEEAPKDDESFFDLGGNSYLSSKAVQAISEEFGKTMNVSDMYEYDTISAQAEFLGKADTE